MVTDFLDDYSLLVKDQSSVQNLGGTGSNAGSGSGGPGPGGPHTAESSALLFVDDNDKVKDTSMPKSDSNRSINSHFTAKSDITVKSDVSWNEEDIAHAKAAKIQNFENALDTNNKSEALKQFKDSQNEIESLKLRLLKLNKSEKVDFAIFSPEDF
jgi:hypothetical protein